MATIRAVAFKSPVNMGGEGELSSWSELKHARKIHLVEKGNFLVFTVLSDKEKRRRRVPMTNVGYIDEDDLPSLAEQERARDEARSRAEAEAAAIDAKGGA